MKIAQIIFIPLYIYLVVGEDNSYSYHKFRGPVSGPVYKITVPNRNKFREKNDFVAKPDYIYAYGVEDPSTGGSHAHKESRDGDVVKGEYKVLQSDGLIRIVRYTADAKSGFKATVEYVKA